MNVVGQRLKFVVDESVAFTYEDGQIVRWSERGSGQGRTQVFQSQDGSTKKVLKSDEGYWWKHYRREAENCFWIEEWFGDYPYGSFGYGFRVCKDSGDVHVDGFETEINPRGLTGQDLFRQECETYAP